MDYYNFTKCHNCICVPVCRNKPKRKLIDDCYFLDKAITDIKNDLPANESLPLLIPDLDSEILVSNIMVTENTGYFRLSERKSNGSALIHNIINIMT